MSFALFAIDVLVAELVIAAFCISTAIMIGLCLLAGKLLIETLPLFVLDNELIGWTFSIFGMTSSAAVGCLSAYSTIGFFVHRFPFI